MSEITNTVTESESEDRVQRLLHEYETRIREALGKDIRPLHEIESDVEEIGRDMNERLTAEIVNKYAARYLGTRAACSCGSRAKFYGQRSRRVITLHGSVSFERSYYYCRSCGRSFCPADLGLQIGRKECSRTVQALAARLSSYLPFALAADELALLRGVRLSATAVQTIAKQVGERIGQEWDAVQNQVPAPVRFDSTSGGGAAERLYLSMDGVKAHVGGEWRDAKLGVAYRRSADGAIAQTSYYGSFERSKQFGPRMRTLANRCGATPAGELEVVADGAEWIWNETNEWFPESVQVLDFYHLSEHLWVVANRRFGDGSVEAQQWMSLQKSRLLSDQAGQVIDDIASWQPKSKASKETQRTTICYMQRHRDRTNYKSLLEQGFDIGSGIMESGCKRVVKARLGGAGMRWEKPGAAAVLHLSALRNGTTAGNFINYTRT